MREHHCGQAPGNIASLRFPYTPARASSAPHTRPVHSPPGAAFSSNSSTVMPAIHSRFRPPLKCRNRRPYGVSTAGCLPVTRLNASVNFVVDDLTAAFDSLSVPVRTIEPSSFAACTVAALRMPAFSTCIVHRQYSLAIIPTRSVKNAFAEPERTELARRCMPGIAATVEPNIVPITTSTSTSSTPAAINAVEATFAYSCAKSRSDGL